MKCYMSFKTLVDGEVSFLSNSNFQLWWASGGYRLKEFGPLFIYKKEIQLPHHIYWIIKNKEGQERETTSNRIKFLLY